MRPYAASVLVEQKQMHWHYWMFLNELTRFSAEKNNLQAKQYRQYGDQPEKQFLYNLFMVLWYFQEYGFHHE